MAESRTPQAGLLRQVRQVAGKLEQIEDGAAQRQALIQYLLNNGEFVVNQPLADSVEAPKRGEGRRAAAGVPAVQITLPTYSGEALAELSARIRQFNDYVNGTK
jgi:hypothetical protein